jgi:hypothetical protein
VVDGHLLLVDLLNLEGLQQQQQQQRDQQVTSHRNYYCNGRLAVGGWVRQSVVMGSTVK